MEDALYAKRHPRSPGEGEGRHVRGQEKHCMSHLDHNYPETRAPPSQAVTGQKPAEQHLLAEACLRGLPQLVSGAVLVRGLG